MGGPGGFMGGPHGEAPTSKVSKRGIGLDEGERDASGQTYTSTSTNENAVLARGGRLGLTGCTVKKTGDSDDGDATSFYGTNAAVLALRGATVSLADCRVETSAKGANGVVAYGGTVELEDVSISCEKNLSRGIHATGGGTITARRLTVKTEGDNSSVIATDRGGGTVNVSGGHYTCQGKDCAVVYSTGCITVDSIVGASAKGEIAVVEGDNEVNILGSTMLSGDVRRGMLILQSGSGDAEGRHGRITVVGGSLTLTSPQAPLCEVTTSTEGTLRLRDTKLCVPSGVLLRADYNRRWRTTEPTAHLVLESDSCCQYTGNVEADEHATVTVEVAQRATWNGAYDPTDSARQTTATIEGTWNLTADSYVDRLVIGEKGTVNTHGHQLVYGQLENHGRLQ